MLLTKGTPKNLPEAIANALHDYGIERFLPFSQQAELIGAVKLHVEDFLAQKFGAAMLNEDGAPESEQALKGLWKAIRS